MNHPVNLVSVKRLAPFQGAGQRVSGVGDAGQAQGILRGKVVAGNLAGGVGGVHFAGIVNRVHQVLRATVQRVAVGERSQRDEQIILARAVAEYLAMAVGVGSENAAVGGINRNLRRMATEPGKNRVGRLVAGAVITWSGHASPTPVRLMRVVAATGGGGV